MLHDSADREQCLYVTQDDIKKLPNFAGDTLLAVRGQQGATLEVPDPDEGMEYPTKRFQMILKSNTGKIEVLLVSNNEEQTQQTPPSLIPQQMQDIHDHLVDPESEMGVIRVQADDEPDYFLGMDPKQDTIPGMSDIFNTTDAAVDSMMKECLNIPPGRGLLPSLVCKGRPAGRIAEPSGVKDYPPCVRTSPGHHIWHRASPAPTPRGLRGQAWAKASHFWREPSCVAPRYPRPIGGARSRERIAPRPGRRRRARRVAGAPGEPSARRARRAVSPWLGAGACCRSAGWRPSWRQPPALRARGPRARSDGTRPGGAGGERRGGAFERPNAGAGGHSREWEMTSIYNKDFGPILLDHAILLRLRFPGPISRQNQISIKCD
eukprot:scaffold1041_cov414-Prasinococcus_capsulatus_cf.AAC.10